jgi:hypothetical protein
MKGRCFEILFTLSASMPVLGKTKGQGPIDAVGCSWLSNDLFFCRSV